jgi:hypothetical protein
LIRALLAALLMCLSAALAYAAGQAPVLKIPDGGTGGSTAATARASLGAANAAHLINIEDTGGAKPDTVKLTCTVTTTSGSTAFGLTGCVNYVTAVANASPLALATVGSRIIIDHAGASLGTAPIANTLTLVSKGSGYLAFPKITITDATGTGGYIEARMGLAAATLVYGGAGCPNGVQTFPLVGGDGTFAQVSGTVTGGVLTGALTVAAPGFYTAFDDPDDYVYPHSMFLSNTIGCTSQPVIDASFEVEALAFFSGGQNYTAPAVSIEGNATLSAISLTAPVAKPLATTIASITGAGTGTLAAPAQQTLAAAAGFVIVAGTDNHDAIQNVFNQTAADGQSSSAVYIPATPPGWCYGFASTVSIPDTYPIGIQGAATDSSVICATAEMSVAFAKGDGFMFYGSTLQNFTVDGMKVAATVFAGNCNSTQKWVNVNIKNPAPYGVGMAIGDGIKNCSGGSHVNEQVLVDRNMYLAQSDLPLIGRRIRNTDIDFTNGKVIGYSWILDWVDAGGAGTHFTNEHVSSTDRSTICFRIDAGTIGLIYPECDRAILSGIDINSANVMVSGGLMNTPTGITRPVFGIRIADSLNFVDVQNWDASRLTLVQNRVKFMGVIGRNVTVADNFGAWPVVGFGRKTILCAGGRETYVPTTSTSEVVFLSCFIPPGILGWHGHLSVDAKWSMTGTNDADHYDIRLGDGVAAVADSPNLSAWRKPAFTPVPPDTSSIQTLVQHWEFAAKNSYNAEEYVSSNAPYAVADRPGFFLQPKTTAAQDMTLPHVVLMTTLQRPGDAGLLEFYEISIIPY